MLIFFFKRSIKIIRGRPFYSTKQEYIIFDLQLGDEINLFFLPKKIVGFPHEPYQSVIQSYT